MEVGGAQVGLGYTGEWWDAAVGLQYLRARWYDPGTGRFTQKDLLDTTAFYRYTNNNPILYTDLSGLLPFGPSFGYIESIVREQGVPLFGITTHGQEDWLRAAVTSVPELEDLYLTVKNSISSGRFSSSTLRELYKYAVEEARKESSLCGYFKDLEHAHAALIVLAHWLQVKLF